VAGNVMCSDEDRHIHRGSVRAWDLCVPYGSAAYPIAEGRVIYAGCNNAGGYGCWLYIDHGAGYKAIYAHMIAGSITVAAGDTVRQDQQIGRVGWTGMTSFGPHVHLEIHHAGAVSGRVLIGDYFDRRLLEDCPLCNVSGSPVVANGMVGSRPTIGNAGGAVGALWPFLMGVAVTLALVGLFYSPEGPVMFSLWHGGSVALVLLVLLLRPTTTAAATAPGDWQAAYAVTIGSEGNRCTHDPVRTAGGITQGTYDAWRMAQGLGPADVCQSLTEQQRQQIFYSRYWVASGASRLPGALALTYVDFAFNAGNGAAREGLAACGLNVACFNNYRDRFYRSASLCYLYCNGWLNRLDRIRELTEGR
jgi:murein DD-endopeptidase MepM/ murein hydrolase activator NlpD